MLVWSLGPRKLCLEEAKQNQTENTQRAEKSRFSKNWLSVGWKNYPKNLVKFQKVGVCKRPWMVEWFPLGVTHFLKNATLVYSWDPQLALQNEPPAPCFFSQYKFGSLKGRNACWVVLPLGKSWIATNTWGCTGHPPAHLQDTFIIY